MELTDSGPGRGRGRSENQKAITMQGGKFHVQVIKGGAGVTVGWEPDLVAWNSGLTLTV